MIRDKLRWCLIEMERVRNKVNDTRDYPASDYPYRVCQAIVAEALGFKNRNEWDNNKYMKIKNRV